MGTLENTFTVFLLSYRNRSGIKFERTRNAAGTRTDRLPLFHPIFPNYHSCSRDLYEVKADEAEAQVNFHLIEIESE